MLYISQDLNLVFVVHLQIRVADRYEKVRFFHCYKRGVDRVFIDHPSFLEKVKFSSSLP